MRQSDKIQNRQSITTGVGPYQRCKRTCFAEVPTLDLSIIVVSHHTLDLLRQCLLSIYRNYKRTCDYEFEVLVVANSASDSNIIELTKVEFPQIRLIENYTQDSSLTSAYNKGLYEARGCYLLLLNAEAKIIGSLIWQMVTFLESEPKAAVVSPFLNTPIGGVQKNTFAFPTLVRFFLAAFPLERFLTTSHKLEHFLNWIRNPTPFEIEVPLLSCFMVRRMVLEQVGLIDENFSNYMAEVDWCYRIKQAQMPRGYVPPGLRWRPGRKFPLFWEIYCLPTAKTVYPQKSIPYVSQSNEETLYKLYRNRNYFYKKHYSHRFQFAATWLMRLELLYKLTTASLIGFSGDTNAASLPQTYQRVSTRIKHFGGFVRESRLGNIEQ